MSGLITNTSGYYCCDYLAADEARYQSMMSKYGGKIPAGEDEYNKDVHHRNNRKDRNQATMNNMGMERGRMRKESDNQSSGKATAKIDSKTAAAAASTSVEKAKPDGMYLGFSPVLGSLVLRWITWIPLLSPCIIFNSDFIKEFDRF